MVKLRTSKGFAVFFSLVFVIGFASDSFARKAVRPVVGPDRSIASWEEVEVPDERAPMGVAERRDVVGVFGYPEERLGLNIEPLKAGIDTMKPLTEVYTKCAKGDELPTSGPWNARCYVQFHTGFFGFERKPMRDWVGEEQYDLIDQVDVARRRKMIKYCRPCYGEQGMRYLKMVYYYEPQDVKGTSLFVRKPMDEAKADDMWLYLPAIRRVRRLPGSQKMDLAAGMDLSYDQLDRNPGAWNMSIIGEETIYVDKPPISNCYGSEAHRAYLEGKHCVVVEMTPRNKDWSVSRDLLYYDKASGSCYYEGIYNKKGELERISLPFMAHLYPKNPTYWSLGDVHAHDLLSNHKTRYGPPEYDRAGHKIFDYATRDWSNYLFWYDVGVPDEYFSQEFMMRGTR
jgi:hypothetical protein